MTGRIREPEGSGRSSAGSVSAAPAAHAHPHEHGDRTKPDAENDCAMTAGPRVTEVAGVDTAGDAVVATESRAGYDVDAGIQALWQIGRAHV